MVKLIGVMGNEGKNTVLSMIDLIFKNAGYFSMVISDQYTKQKKKGASIIAISKKGIEAITDYETELDIVVDANMDLDQYDENNYFYDKARLVQRLKPNKPLIINADYEDSIKLAYENRKAIIMTYGLNGRSSLTASSLDLDSSIKFNLCLQRTIETLCNTYVDPFEHPIEVNLTGMDNLYCTFAAISVALYLNIDLDIIIKAFIMLDKNKTKLD